MNDVEYSPDRTLARLISIAMSVHNVVGGMPVAVKARGEPGVIIASGRPKDLVCGSEALDSVFSEKPVRRTYADCGDYAGIPMYASAIFDEGGNAVAAIGVIDTSGLFSLNEFVKVSTAFHMQSGVIKRPKK
jgi:hypothetical protein